VGAGRGPQGEAARTGLGGGRGDERGSRPQSSFVGGTPRAQELAGRLGIDPSKLATASDLKSNVPALAAGDRVTHQRYGVGRVLQVEGYGARAQAQIDFGEQVMWIVLRHAPIEKL
jgi:DNA helicase-2/ATP-dependent DNA helicase PcrA